MKKLCESNSKETKEISQLFIEFATIKIRVIIIIVNLRANYSLFEKEEQLKERKNYRI